MNSTLENVQTDTSITNNVKLDYVKVKLGWKGYVRQKVVDTFYYV